MARQLEVRVNKEKFIAGGILGKVEAWKNITSDQEIIGIVKNGVKISFQDQIPQNKPFEYKRSVKEHKILTDEIQKMLEMKIISQCHDNTEGYFSNMFTKLKADGSKRAILNLKYLNPHCEARKFKMTTLKEVINMIKPNSYLASIDIEKAYFSVPINDKYKKFLRFSWLGKIYQFECMPNGYKDAMRLFTKLLKAPIATLRRMGFEIIIYVDDSLIQANSYQECVDSIKAIIKMLTDLGFKINLKKSVVDPTKIIIFLGFSFDTVNMTITLVEGKKNKIVAKAKSLLASNKPSIREVSSLLGSMTAAMEAVPLGKLNFRNLEMDKIAALKFSKGEYQSPCFISKKGKDEIRWWISTIPTAVKSLLPPPRMDYTIFTDATHQ